MKSIRLVVAFLVISIVTRAQKIIITPEINTKQYKKDLLPQKPFKNSFLLSENLLFNSPTTFLYSTTKGEVFELYLDNSRCLVPDFNSNMPVSRKFPPGYIPNVKKK